MKRSALRKEILLAVGLIAFGLFFLPALIYLVGQQVVGEYAAEGGLVALYDALGNSLLVGNWATWLLVLSPYIVIQLSRLTWWLHRQRVT